jgi:hypothetical protein
MVMAVTAVSEPMAEVRVSTSVCTYMMSAPRATGGAMATNTPSAHATPLPPRNPRYTGKMWPSTAAMATAAIPTSS